MNQPNLENQQNLRITNSVPNTGFKIGTAYLIRTVTMMYAGRVVDITNFSIELEKSSWVADSGRYSQALTDGTLSEVEVYPAGNFVTLGSIVDFAVWNHELPTTTK